MILYSMFIIMLISSAKCFEGRDIEVFTTIMSGHYSNAKSLSQLREDGIITAQNVIDFYSFPIQYPALKSEVVIFFNELKDGIVTRQQFCAINQSGPVLQMDLFNVRQSKLFNQASVDIIDLESLSRDDLEIAPVCQSLIRRIGETMFTTEYPNCNVEGFNSATYKTTHTCNNITFYVDSPEFPESKSKLPYLMNKEESYPVPSTIFPDYDKYKSMCGY